MAPQKKGITTYERDKNKVKISGEPENVKWQIWFDLVANKLFWLLLVIILLVVLPKASFIPILLKWIKQQLPFMTLFVVAVGWIQLFLSG
jgi:hypothetical protein